MKARGTFRESHENFIERIWTDVRHFESRYNEDLLYKHRGKPHLFTGCAVVHILFLRDERDGECGTSVKADSSK